MTSAGQVLNRNGLTRIAAAAVTNTDWTVEIRSLPRGGHQIIAHNPVINDSQILTYRDMDETRAREHANNIWADIRQDPQSWVRLVSR
jgi:hypothetical protein